jgi:hypothetical protein
MTDLDHLPVLSPGRLRIGGIFGAVANRVNFCHTPDDVVTMEDWRLMRMGLFAIVVAIVGANAPRRWG